MPNMPVTAEMFKQTYCKSNFNTCARFIVATALGKNNVPNDLSANQEEKANILILKI